MPKINKALKISGISDLKEYLNQDGIFISDKKIRVRINPDKMENLDKDIPIPDMLIDAINISNEEGEKAALFTYLGDQSLRSFLIPSENIFPGVEISHFDKNSSTDLFGAIDTDDYFERSVELKDMREILKKEEFDRGKIDVFKVKVSNKHNFGGFSPVDTSEVEAKRIIHKQKVMYIIENSWDNYVRPDLVSVGHLEAEPAYLYSTTPEADAKKTKSEEIKINNAISENRRILQRESEERKEAKKEANANEIAKKISNIFYEKINTPEGKKLSRESILMLQSKIDKVEAISKNRILLSINPKDTPKEILVSLNEQLELEIFKAKNGFYIQAHHDNKSKMYVAKLFDENDNLLSTVGIKDHLLKEKDILFYSEDYKENHRIEVMRMEDFHNDIVINELGKKVDEDLKFEEFYAYISSLSFTEDRDDIPPLSFADELHDINNFNGLYIMHEISSDKAAKSEIKKEIDNFMESIIHNKYDSDNSMAM